MTKTYNDKDLQNFIRQTIGDINATFRLGALSQDESSSDIALYDEELVKRTVFPVGLKNVHTIDEMMAWLKPLGYSETITRRLTILSCVSSL